MIRFLLAIGAVLFFLIGSWMLVRPTPQQRRLGDIRAAAARRGLRVAVQEDQAGVALGQGEAAYMLGLVPGQSWAADFSLLRQLGKAGAVAAPGFGGYTLNGRAGAGVTGGGDLESGLRRIAAQVPAVHCVRGKGAVAVWSEEGGEETLDAIHAVLRALMQMSGPEAGQDAGKKPK